MQRAESELVFIVYLYCKQRHKDKKSHESLLFKKFFITVLAMTFYLGVHDDL
jgi:hypothetical protein